MFCGRTASHSHLSHRQFLCSAPQTAEQCRTIFSGYRSKQASNNPPTISKQMKRKARQQEMRERLDKDYRVHTINDAMMMMKEKGGGGGISNDSGDGGLMRITLHDNMAKMSTASNGHRRTPRGVQPSQLQGVGIGPTCQCKSDARVWMTVRTHRMKMLDKLGVMAAGEGMKFNVLYDGVAKETEEYKEDKEVVLSFPGTGSIDNNIVVLDQVTFGYTTGRP
jgi:hypothetical protein